MSGALPGVAPLALSDPAAASALWYLDRATGVVALVVFTAVLVLGVLTRGNAAPLRLPRFVVAGLHRNLALLAVALLAVHIAAAVADPFAPIRVVDVFVPFGAAYRPVWLGFGAMSLDLMLAVVVTSLMRSRLGRRAWRAVHLTTWAAWPVALLHGLGTGTDARTSWMLALTGGCVMVVLLSGLWRVLTLASATPVRRMGATALLAGAPVALAAWVLAGPLAPGWAARAGTPTALLASSHSSSTAGTTRGTGAGSAAPGGSNLAAPTGTSRFDGTVAMQQGSAQATVVISGQLRGGVSGELTIQLVGAPLPGGGVSLSSGTVSYTGGAGSAWRGPVTNLSGGTVGATLNRGSQQVQVQVLLRVDSSSGHALGEVTFA